MKRKSFIQYTIALVAAIVGMPKKLFSASGSCITDEDVEGPFHRNGTPERSDLTFGYEGQGRPLTVTGTVLSDDCSTPIPQAVIDLWHAGPNGQYDQTTSNYTFRGVLRSDQNGKYSFKTMIPAGYKDGPLDRPAHIHYKVSAKGYKPLTTQVYFEGDPKLAQDPFIRQNNGLKRALPYPKNTYGVHQMTFNIVLQAESR